MRHIDALVSPVQLAKAYYKFGVHRFRVGRAIGDILHCLEQRYGVDFKELERAYQSPEKR